MGQLSFVRSKFFNFTFASLLISAPLFTAGAADNLNSAQRKAQGIVYMNLGDEPPGMDPTKQVDSVGSFWMGHVFEGLTTTDKSGATVNGTAENMSVSPDGKTYTFTIRKTAKWQDGKPVTAHDFVYAFRRLVDPAFASTYSFIAQTAHIVNATPIIEKKQGIETLGVKALNDLTLEIKLDSPVAFFPSLMSFQVFFPVRKDIVEKHGDKFATNVESIVGNGPFKVKSWVKENSMALEKSETYWNAKAIKIKGIVNPSIIKDSGAQYNVFTTGGLDFTGLDAERIKIALKEKKRTIPFMEGSVFYLETNTRAGKPFHDVRLRQALKLALNRGEYINRIYAIPGNKPAFGLVPDIMPGSKPGSTYRKEAPLRWKDGDVAGAKKLIKEYLAATKQAKVPGFTLLAGDSSVAKKDADYYQSVLSKVFETEVKVDSVPFKTRLQKMRDNHFDVVLAGWGPDYLDAMTFMDLFTSTNENNRSGYANPKYDALIAKASTSNSLAERVKIFAEAEKILMDDAPIVPFFQRARVYLLADGLVDVQRRVVGADPDFRYASWKSATAKK